MKQIIWLAVFLIAISGVSAATTVDMNWNGGGTFGANFAVDDDATAAFTTVGSFASGTFHMTEGVDSTGWGVKPVSTKVNAEVTNGFIQYQYDRTDSYYGSEQYGPVDRSSYSYIDSMGGTAELELNARSDVFKFGTNGAHWADSNSFVADGTYYAEHKIENGADNFAFFKAGGIGTLDIEHQKDSTGGDYNSASINFGKGTYVGSDVTQTGVGSFGVGAHYENGFEMGGLIAGGPVDYSQNFNFGDGFSWTDYSFKGD